MKCTTWPPLQRGHFEGVFRHGAAMRLLLRDDYLQ